MNSLAIGFIKEAFSILGKEFDPGIPMAREKSSINIPQGFTRLVIQKHDADKAGTHLDIRLHSGSKAYSWATREWPINPGEKTLAKRQPDHKSSYSDFQGEIKEGYGKGHVTKQSDDQVDIVFASNDKIKFVMPNGNEYAMIHTGNDDWLLLRMKQFVGSITSKPKYKDIPAGKLDFNNPDTILQPKVDGAHSIIELNKNGVNRVYSYRVSKRTDRPIEHTNQIPTIRDAYVPKQLSNTILRAEIFARDKKGIALPPQQISGILNSGIGNARQREELVPMAFDVVQYRGRNVEDKPYAYRYGLLERINKAEPAISIPEIARTPQEKVRLWKRIASGKHPDTKEGVVEWNLDNDRTRKVKIRNEYDVYIRGIDPDKRRISYSHTKKGPTAGWVSSGINNETSVDMHRFPQMYIGKPARLSAQEKFSSGALRAPSFISTHIEKGLEQ